MLSAGHQEGFSIIELSVALTVVAVLLTLGVPSLSGYIQNARLGAAAKSFYTGLQIARAEAVKRNAEVEFVMTDTAVASGIENALVADAQGRNWVVRARASASAPYELIEAKSIFEGGGASPAVTVAASAALVSFNALGGTLNGGGQSIVLENPAMGLCVPLGPVRCWNVVVSPGGQVRLCNPDPAASASDTRKC
jgi:type IV fimbrial biogenesis protein FimT